MSAGMHVSQYQLACMYLNVRFHGSHLLHRLGIPGLGASLELRQSHSQPGERLEEKGFNMRSWRSFGNALVVSHFCKCKYVREERGL